MAMASAGAGGSSGRRRRGGRKHKPMADINMTPFIDVMLVLLIIFLITVPVVTQSVKLNLPKEINIPTQTKPENVLLALQ